VADVSDVSGNSDCLFCRIVAGEIPADVVSQREQSLAIKDLEPQAPTHVLVITKAHHSDLGALAAADPALAGALTQHATEVAGELGLDDYRVVFNTGALAGQSVFHVHGHVLGGRAMRWPPG
jgi:histidine triad (HIT) family protein